MLGYIMFTYKRDNDHISLLSTDLPSSTYGRKASHDIQ